MNSCVVAQAIRKTIVLNTPCQTADATSGEQLLGDQLSMNVGEQSVQRQFVFQVGGVLDNEMRNLKTSSRAQTDQEQCWRWVPATAHQ